jgi:hypothetical protein
MKGQVCIQENTERTADCFRKKLTDWNKLHNDLWACSIVPPEADRVRTRHSQLKSFEKNGLVVQW